MERCPYIYLEAAFMDCVYLEWCTLRDMQAAKWIIVRPHKRMGNEVDSMTSTGEKMTRSLGARIVFMVCCFM